MVCFQCEGWWEQREYGRQPMENLQLDFVDGQISGSGCDLVGEFLFSGELSHQQIYLHKQYVGQHHIDYHGTYDGEGVYFGHWSYGGRIGGQWSIRIGRPVNQA